MRSIGEPMSITLSDFELLVKDILDGAAGALVDYRSEHLASLDGADGEYVIEVVATFSALGAAHGIALVEVATGISNWHTRSAGLPTLPPPWAHCPRYIGWLCAGNRRSLFSEDHAEYTRAFLGLGNNEWSGT